MLSHLRFHKRDRSNPTSPTPPDNTHNPWGDLQPAQLVPDNGVPAPDVRPRSSQSVPFGPHSQNAQQHSNQPPAVSPVPVQHAPTLPPIPRVASEGSELSIDLSHFGSRSQDEIKPREESRPPPQSPYNEASRFIGGLALQNLRREQEASGKGGQYASDPNLPYGMPTNTLTNVPSRPAPPARQIKGASSFIAPMDMHKTTATGKRPPGARITSDTQVYMPQNIAQEQPRGKKGLPFLKNPVSTLLLRRKTSQNVPDLSLQLQQEEPVYDPRIRGTRVHDFSAPRPKRATPINDVAPGRLQESRPDQNIINSTSKLSLDNNKPLPPAKDDDDRIEPHSSQMISPNQSVTFAPAVQEQPLDHKSTVKSTRILSTSSRRQRSSVPSISSLSRNTSGASARALPKHMKSTSSRFSFDMLGAANEEKLLEERHRQRQQDKRDGDDFEEDDDQGGGFRDSRFDDFDEDAFDYDAMDYDDGLEERIPGVNADYDEDDFEATLDPDDDQENFGGFLFQRSDPNSLVTSPLNAGPLITPRDPDGKVIGYASAGHTPTYPPQQETIEEEVEDDLIPKPLRQSSPMGLGIHSIEPSTESSNDNIPLEKQPETVLSPDDELYFKSDDFSGEGDGTAFDESLFDLDDTDRYGRPLPGVFANALAQRIALEDEARRRESEATSRLSAQSELSQSTAHTSLSVGLQNKTVGLGIEGDILPPLDPPMQRPEASAAEKEQVAAYQAALAAAAYEAAASGKFRRDSSPTPTDHRRDSSTLSASPPHQEILESIEDYEAEDDTYADFDDYELDDDAIIAEVNASALANDSDGWYGQEFGFYAAPTQQTHHTGKSLTEQNLYQYSNGGFFGPSGLKRSTSGPAVSREPNLTPITERSEYSNRNSIMSLAMPPGINNPPLQSPGLAQLAMMADDDNMSLSALLRLRSKAWGGSQASLSSREGSPSDRNGASSPFGQEPSSFLGVAPSHGRKNSSFSVWSQESAGPNSSAGSPTITMASPIMPTGLSIPPPPLPAGNNSNSSPSLGSGSIASPQQPSSSCPPVFEDDEYDGTQTATSVSNSSSVYMSSGENPMSPKARKSSQKRPGMGHRHKNSADSISYTKEEESGETRWVLERRRTAESGEIELLGREVIQGGRI